MWRWIGDFESLNVSGKKCFLRKISYILVATKMRINQQEDGSVYRWQCKESDCGITVRNPSLALVLLDSPLLQKFLLNIHFDHLFIFNPRFIIFCVIPKCSCYSITQMQCEWDPILFFINNMNDLLIGVGVLWSCFNTKSHSMDFIYIIFPITCLLLPVCLTHEERFPKRL